MHLTFLGLVMATVRVAPAADDWGGWRDRSTFTLSERARGESVDRFRPPRGTASPGAERYSFFASRLRG